MHHYPGMSVPEISDHYYSTNNSAIKDINTRISTKSTKRGRAILLAIQRLSIAFLSTVKTVFESGHPSVHD